MTITYRVKNGLYDNITNQCSNACTFCVRNTKESVGDSDSLWLDREPAANEVLEDILRHDLTEYDELVFCGYGEPFCRLDVILEVVKKLREHSDIPVRINTNGQGDLINKKKTAPLLSGLINTLSISLNAPTAEEYQEICYSEFGVLAFDAMIAFATEAKQYVDEVVFSVVDVIGEKKIAECQKIADTAGVKLRVRRMIED